MRNSLLQLVISEQSEGLMSLWLHYCIYIKFKEKTPSLNQVITLWYKDYQ